MHQIMSTESQSKPMLNDAWACRGQRRIMFAGVLLSKLMLKGLAVSPHTHGPVVQFCRNASRGRVASLLPMMWAGMVCHETELAPRQKYCGDLDSSKPHCSHPSSKGSAVLLTCIQCNAAAANRAPDALGRGHSTSSAGARHPQALQRPPAPWGSAEGLGSRAAGLGHYLPAAGLACGTRPVPAVRPPQEKVRRFLVVPTFRHKVYVSNQLELQDPRKRDLRQSALVVCMHPSAAIAPCCSARLLKPHFATGICP